MSTVASIVTSTLALRSAADRGFAWAAACITGLEALLLSLLVIAIALNLTSGSP